MKRLVFLCVFSAAMSIAHADVSVTDSDTLARAANAGHSAATTGPVSKAANKRNGVPLGAVKPHATGSIALIDASGLKYFINTDITFSTSSSASAGMSEASYTHSVAATTSAGGTVLDQLNDAFDGYQSICLSLNNSVSGRCESGNANYVIYNKDGAPTLDGTCNNRQVIFNAQTAGSVSVSRKVYVPTDDSFARWLDIVTNTSGTAQTVTLETSNNLGSDNNTIITASSSGSTTSPLTDTSLTWVATFQNFSGSTTTDPRLGHVMEGPGAAVPLAGVNFTNGDDNPFWGYTLTLQPGATGIIMNFVTGQPSRAAAAAQAARLVTLPTTALECMTAAEKTEVLNFNAAPAPVVAVSVPGPDGLKLALLAALLAVIGFLGLRARTR
jgi:hypothetical protein